MEVSNLMVNKVHDFLLATRSLEEINVIFVSWQVEVTMVLDFETAQNFVYF